MRTVDLDEAAGILKVHPNTVMELAKTGEIPAAKLGRAWVFLDEDLTNFVIKQIREQTQRRVLSPHAAG